MTDPWGGDIEAWAKSLGPADLEASDWRKRLCRALTLPPDTSWTEVVQAARDAGIVRDAEYRASDRVFEENKRLRAQLAAQAPVVQAATALVEHWQTGKDGGRTNDLMDVLVQAVKGAQR